MLQCLVDGRTRNAGQFFAPEMLPAFFTPPSKINHKINKAFSTSKLPSVWTGSWPTHLDCSPHWYKTPMQGGKKSWGDPYDGIWENALLIFVFEQYNRKSWTQYLKTSLLTLFYNSNFVFLNIYHLKPCKCSSEWIPIQNPFLFDVLARIQENREKKNLYIDAAVSWDFSLLPGQQWHTCLDSLVCVLGFHGWMHELHRQWTELRFQHGFCSVTYRYLWFGFRNLQTLPHMF